jgi:plasmid replication initiation protein
VLLGRPDDERLQKLEYRIFKRDTLRPAMAEINAVADIEIEMLEFKSGRFVSDLQFTVRKKPQKTLALQQRSAAEPVDVAVLGERRASWHRTTRVSSVSSTNSARPQ